MSEIDFAEQFRRTNEPFAIDRSGVTRRTHRTLRPRGIGSIEYVVRGKGTVTENNRTFQVKAGDVFILHPGEYHDYYPDPDEPWYKIWLQISGFGIPEILRMYGLSNVNHIPDFDVTQDFARIRSVINRKTTIETIDQQGPLLLIELLQKLSGEVKRRKNLNTKPSPAPRIREFIETSPNGNITLEQLAKEFNISKHHLTRLFKQEYGITPHEYILNHRIALAQSLLKRTSLTMQEIATQLDFCDAAYFSEFFHKQTGMTPLQFRKKYK